MISYPGAMVQMFNGLILPANSQLKRLTIVADNGVNGNLATVYNQFVEDTYASLAAAYAVPTGKKFIIAGLEMDIVTGIPAAAFKYLRLLSSTVTTISSNSALTGKATLKTFVYGNSQTAVTMQMAQNWTFSGLEVAAGKSIGICGVNTSDSEVKICTNLTDRQKLFLYGLEVKA